MLGLSEKENQYLQLMLIHVPYELILESEMAEFRSRILIKMKQDVSILLRILDMSFTFVIVCFYRDSRLIVVPLTVIEHFSPSQRSLEIISFA